MTATTFLERAQPVGHAPMRPVGSFAVKSRGSVDPSRYSDEVFELFSIPAYDSRKPEVLLGAEIGSAKKIVAPGDVLISRIVPHIQRVWVVGPSNGHRQIASGEWIVFGHSETDPDYLRHMLLSKPFHDQFMQTVAGMGGSLLRARPSEVERIEIPVPSSRTEQRRIAAILDKADTIRRKREQALTLADDFLRSVFLEMFGDPATNPLGFSQRSLGSCSRFTSGATPSKANPAFWIGEFPWVSPKDMKVDTIWDAEDHVSDLAFEQTNLKRIDAGTPLIVVRGMILVHTVPMAMTARDVAINQDMKAILFDKDIDPLFGFWCLKVQHEHILGKVDTAAHGTKRLDTDRLGEVMITVPDDDEQKKFLTIVLKFNKSRDVMSASAAESSNLLAALSQRAFAGGL